MIGFKMRSVFQTLAAFAVAATTFSFTGSAQAVPTVQIDLPDGEYGSDISVESTELTLENGETTAQVSVLVKLSSGNVDTLENVRLVIAFDDINTDYSGISLTQETAEGTVALAGSFGTGDVPVGLESAAVYGSGTSYIEFDLGAAFTQLGHSIENVAPLEPGEVDEDGGNATGEIRTYTLTLSGITGTVHLDAVGYNPDSNANEPYKNSPNSHDGAISTSSSVPELSASGFTSAAALLGGAALLTTSRRRRTS